MREMHEHEVWALMARAEERYRARLSAEKTIFPKNNLTAWFTDDTTVSPAQMGKQPNANTTMNPKLNTLLVSLVAVLAAATDFLQSKLGTASADTPKPKEPETPPAGKKAKTIPAPAPAPVPATEPISVADDDDDDDDEITLGGEAVNYVELRNRLRTFLAPKLPDKAWRKANLNPALAKANVSTPVNLDSIPDEALPILVKELGA